MTITMYDSIDPATVKGVASTSHEAVAGYVNGRWPDARALDAAFPHDYHVGIAVTAYADADCLDVETGDATPAQVPGWVRRQHARGESRPIVYAALSEWGLILSQLHIAGISHSAIRIWTAHWTFKEHICGRQCGFPEDITADATQWTDKSHGRNLDESLLADDFFQLKSPPHPKPPPKPPGKKPHPKVIAAAGGSAIAAVLAAVANAISGGVHLSTGEIGAFCTVLAAIAGYLVPSPTSPRK